MCLAVPLVVSTRGASGTYTISGVAYGPDKAVLANKNLHAYYAISGSKAEFTTGEHGEYEFDVHWSYGKCKSGRRRGIRIGASRDLNPKYVTVHYGKSMIRIKNNWKHYANIKPSSNGKRIRKLDLNFNGET